MRSNRGSAATKTIFDPAAVHHCLDSGSGGQ
jgi:hypothetical protein